MGVIKLTINKQLIKWISAIVLIILGGVLGVVQGFASEIMYSPYLDFQFGLKEQPVLIIRLFGYYFNRGLPPCQKKLDCGCGVFPLYFSGCCFHLCVKCKLALITTKHLHIYRSNEKLKTGRWGRD